MELTERMLKRFCKDYKIPISIYINPYFNNRLMLMEKDYKAFSNFLTFSKEVCGDFESEQEYFEYYNEVKENALQSIKNSKGFYYFNNCYDEIDDSTFAEPLKGVGKDDVYKSHNVGKKFISTDMVQANFNVLKRFAKGIFNDSDTWEGFMSAFTTKSHITESKYIRQVILGNCNPRRQVRYEKAYMAALSRYFSEEWVKKARVYTYDEIVFEVDDFSEWDNSNMPNIIAGFSHDNGIPLRVEKYTLNGLNGYGYVKYFVDGTRKIMCVRAEFLPMIIRVLDRERITSYDYTFMFEGELAHLDHIPLRIKELQDYLSIQDNGGLAGIVNNP